MILDFHAIIRAYPNATIVDEETGVFDKDNNKINLDQSKIDEARAAIDKEADDTKYQRDRATAYPSLADQLDMQYWDQVNGTTKWKEAVAKVKSDNPKP
tara:strand:- start:41 stop:337 length:297 start_codon:yes stop_codon:yes gene_type:complete